MIELAGELDLSTIPVVETRLMRMLRTHDLVVLDLTRLVFIDSTGIALLINAHRGAEPDGTLHMAVSRDSQVERVLSLTGVDRVLSIFRDSDQAIAALPPRASAARTDAA